MESELSGTKKLQVQHLPWILFHVIIALFAFSIFCHLITQFIDWIAGIHQGYEKYFFFPTFSDLVVSGLSKYVAIISFDIASALMIFLGITGFIGMMETIPTGRTLFWRSIHRIRCIFLTISGIAWFIVGNVPIDAVAYGSISTFWERLHIWRIIHIISFFTFALLTIAVMLIGSLISVKELKVANVHPPQLRGVFLTWKIVPMIISLIAWPLIPILNSILVVSICTNSTSCIFSIIVKRFFSPLLEYIFIFLIFEHLASYQWETTNFGISFNPDAKQELYRQIHGVDEFHVNSDAESSHSN